MKNEGARPRERERSVGWIVATAVVVACTGFVRYQSTPERTLGDLVGVERRVGAEFVALAVFQLADCDQTSEFVRVFATAPFRRDFEVHALVAGSGDDMTRAAARLGSDLRGISVRRASRRDMLALRSLGYHATPYVLIVDRAGRLRWVGGPPTSAAEWSSLRASLHALLGTKAETT